MPATVDNDRHSRATAGPQSLEASTILEQSFQQVREQFKTLQKQCDELREQRDEYQIALAAQVDEMTQMRGAVSVLETLYRSTRNHLENEIYNLNVELRRCKRSNAPDTPGIAPRNSRGEHLGEHRTDGSWHNPNGGPNTDRDLDGDVMMTNPYRSDVNGTVDHQTLIDYALPPGGQGTHDSCTYDCRRDRGRGTPAVSQPAIRHENLRPSASTPSHMHHLPPPNASSSSTTSSRVPFPFHRQSGPLITLSQASPASGSGQDDVSVGVESTNCAATRTSCQSLVIPADLSVELEEVPPELKKEGHGWLAVFNSAPSGLKGPEKQLTRNLDVELLHTLSHPSVVCCVRFSANGTYIATGCKGETRIFEVESGSLVCLLVQGRGESEGTANIRCLCFSADGNYITTGGEDGVARLWDIEKTQILSVLKGHSQPVFGLDCSRQGQVIVSASGDGTVRIWDADDVTGKSRQVFYVRGQDEDHTGATCVCLSPDERFVAAGFMDAMVRVWNVLTGQLMVYFNGHNDSVYSVAFTPDCTGIISGSLDKTLKYWDVRPIFAGGKTCVGPYSNLNGEERKGSTMNFTGHKDYVLSVAVSSDGRWVISGSRDRAVRLWDANTAVTQCMLLGHSNSVISLAASPVANVLATGSGDHSARIWKYKAT